MELNRRWVFVIGFLLLVVVSAITYLSLSYMYGPSYTSRKAISAPQPQSSRTSCSAAIDNIQKEENFTFISELCQLYIDAIPVNVSEYKRAYNQLSKYQLTNAKYVYLTRDCNCFRSKMGYLTWNEVTQEEKDFPISFSMLMYEHVDQAERLLRLIYRPQNFYCIHVDAKQHPDIHLAVQSIAECFDNIIVAKPAIAVGWGHISIVEAELLCMKQLLEYNKNWKYFINLVSRDFPLRTNLELVKILKAYKGGNDVDGTYKDRAAFSLWADTIWSRSPEPDSRPRWTGKASPPPPHNFSLAKGFTHMVVVRGFAEYAVYDQRARDLKKWYETSKIPDEQYFNTMNHSPQYGIPGAYKGDPEDKKVGLSRLKIWAYVGNDTCHGMFIHFVCIFGVRDLPQLVAAKQLFANKMRPDIDRVAYRCMEHHYNNQTRHPDNKFNVTVYENQPWSLNHV